MSGKLEEFYQEIFSLKLEILGLRQRNDDLNLELAKKSSLLGDAEDKLKRWQAELEIVASKKGHNLCHDLVPRLLKNTIGHTGNFPDPENISPEQFAKGCIAYHADLFPDRDIRLLAIRMPEDLKNKGILTEEQSEKVRKLLFGGDE